MSLSLLRLGKQYLACQYFYLYIVYKDRNTQLLCLNSKADEDCTQINVKDLLSEYILSLFNYFFYSYFSNKWQNSDHFFHDSLTQIAINFLQTIIGLDYDRKYTWSGQYIITNETITCKCCAKKARDDGFI